MSALNTLANLLAYLALRRAAEIKADAIVSAWKGARLGMFYCALIVQLTRILAPSTTPILGGSALTPA